MYIKNKIVTRICGIAFSILFCVSASAQNNTFPTSGNVGVGTINPVKTLDVIGTVKGNEFSFPALPYDFSSPPRTQLGSKSIKLFDDYITSRPGGSSPGNNSYGTLLAIYGRVSHWQTDLYFGASDRRMYFRTSAWSGGASENGVGQFNNWRTILDSHSDVKSTGKLILSGSGNHIISNGNLGIGTENPQAKLAVNGNILAKEIKIKTDIAVPDYVFESDYELRSLDDIANYVKSHKHLPEIPSAQVIIKNGLDLAEMNLLLLKKVEELTLHAIENERKRNELEKKVARLEELLTK